MVTCATPAAVTSKRSRDQHHSLAPVKRHRTASDASLSSHTSGVSHASSDNEHVTSPVDTPLTPSSPASRSSARSKNHSCPHPGCSKTFDRPARLADHIRSHTQERPFVCAEQFCDKAFLRQSHLSHHVKSAHTSIRDHACDWPGCDKRFATATRLRRHQDVHQGGQKYRCTAHDCDRVFRKHATLQRHIDADHLGQKPFRCADLDHSTDQLCGQGFDNAAQLRAHQRRDHMPPSHICTLCISEDPDSSSPPAFATFSDLQSHLRSVHPPTCTHCGRTCKSPRDLSRHLETTHADPTDPADPPTRRFPCPDPSCAKAFTKRSNLNVHVRSVHAREKPFVCGTTDVSSAANLSSWSGTDACGARFTAKASLEAHIARRHLNTPPAHAASRPRPPLTATTTLTQLTGTGYGHDDGRSIPCVDAACAYAFARQHDLVVHAQALHGLEEWEIADALAEREAVSGGRFWVGGLDEDGLDGYAEVSGFDDDNNDHMETLIATGGLDEICLDGLNNEMAVDPALNA